MLFLLSAAPIAVGCVITSDDTTSDTEAATDNNTTTNTPGTTEDPQTTTETPGDTTVTPGETTETPGDTTVTPTDDTVTPGDSTTSGIEIPPACVTYGDTVTLCYDETMGAEAAQYCAESFANYEMNYSAECVTAFEEWLACLSALTCEVFTGPDPVCEKQGTALETNCVAK